MAENEPPHLCYKNKDNDIICHVYTEYSGSLPVNGTLGQALNAENEEEWCAYPVAEYFACRIPSEMEVTMAEFNQSCSIECDLIDPYTLPGNNAFQNLKLIARLHTRKKFSSDYCNDSDRANPEYMSRQKFRDT